MINEKLTRQIIEDLEASIPSLETQIKKLRKELKEQRRKLRDEKKLLWRAGYKLGDKGGEE